jgi:hypothetical protein
MLFNIIDSVKYYMNNTFSRIYYFYYKKRVNRLNKRKNEYLEENELKRMRVN